MSHTLFKTLGIVSWSACILILAYQAAVWGVTAAWPSVTLMDVGTRMGIDLLSLVRSLPLEFALKSAYVLVTTQLSVALWWAGAVLFALAFLTTMLFGK
jgi:hypothetical protein